MEVPDHMKNCWETASGGVLFSSRASRGRVGFISAISHKFCSTCNRLRLTSEGLLEPRCLQYGTAADIKALLRGGASDRQIQETVIQTVLSKPACHHFGEEEKNEDANGKDIQKENREMFRIGG